MGDITNLLSQYITGDELEFRIGYYDRHFVSSITKYMFYYTLSFLTKGDYTVKKFSQIVYQYRGDNNIRTVKDTDTGKVYSQYKKRKNVLDFEKLGIRLALSNERYISTNTEYIQNSKSKIRNRFILYSRHNFNIEMTIDSIGKNYVYQMEVEFRNKPAENEIKSVLNWILSIKDRMQSAQVIVNEFNNLIPSKYNPDPTSPFVGDIMPKNIKRDNVPFMDDYAVINKPNGINYMLYISGRRRKVFLINKTDLLEYKELESYINKDSILDSILFGELLEGVFYCIDMVVYNGQSVIEYDYLNRYSILADIVKKIDTKNVQLIPLFHKGRFYDRLYNCFQYISQVWPTDKNDGIILKPISLPFNNPKTYKWKPDYENTIDFAINRLEENTYALLAYDRKNELIPFLEDSYSINDNLFRQIDKKGEIPPDYTIVEFRYSLDTKKWYPNRVRIDKIKPNFIEVCLSIWEDIQDPFSADELLTLSIDTIDADDTVGGIARKICDYLQRTGDPQVLDGLRKLCKGGQVYNMIKDTVMPNRDKNDLTRRIYNYLSR